MRIPRYWARGSAERADPAIGDVHRTTAFGFSDSSFAEALHDANARATRVIDWLCSGCEIGDPQKYPYGADRPLREQIVREFGTGNDRCAVITRNAYGALVLNTAHVMFIDVDEPRPPLLGGFIGRLLGRKPPEPFAQLKRAIEETPSLGGRIYRTAAGWRGLITSQLVDPCQSATDELMERCGADFQYRRLCVVQRSFRARLTPKPWRCGVARPPGAYPYLDAQAEARFGEWLRTYERRSAERAVCEFVEAVGNRAMDPTAAIVVREHDAATLRAGKNLA